MVINGLLVLAAMLYGVAALLITIFAGSFGVLLVVYWRTRRDRPEIPQVADADLPSVTVQLPIYNEAFVVSRLIDACLRLDYPPGKLAIQVLDDSTDETTVVIQRTINAWRGRSVHPITLLRRPARAGYKAGALAYGLERVETDCIAVFDADFVPLPDFLRRTLPFFCADERLALVQSRWDHLNAGGNWLTRAQALTIDGHFVVEQTARCRGRLPMSMNGTGGVWRVAALKDAGGWSAATLTEDLDLSYRALLRGWSFLYLPDLAVPGELPPQVQAYKLQQNRWATGMTECLLRHAVPLLRAERYGWGRKFMGLMHLSQYAVQPLILLMFLLTPLLLWGDMFRRLPNLGFFGVVGIIPPLIMITAQVDLHRDWPRRLVYMPVQGIVGAAVVVNNTRGVLAAVHRPGVQREFKRTPKFCLARGDSRWSGSRYILPVDATTVGEIGLGVYALVGLVLAVQRLPGLALYMAFYALAFFSFAMWNIYQVRRVSTHPARQVRPAASRADPVERAGR